MLHSDGPPNCRGSERSGSACGVVVLGSRPCSASRSAGAPQAVLVCTRFPLRGRRGPGSGAFASEGRYAIRAGSKIRTLSFDLLPAARELPGVLSRYSFVPQSKPPVSTAPSPGSFVSGSVHISGACETVCAFFQPPHRPPSFCRATRFAQNHPLLLETPNARRQGGGIGGTRR
eukprot:6214996-Prymnesium_polylepis.1